MAWSSPPVMVRVAVPSSSSTLAGTTESVTTGVSSSSRYRFRALASVVPGSPATDPRTHKTFVGLNTESSTAVTVTVPVLHLEFAGIVSVRFSLSVMSSLDAPLPTSTRTVTVTSYSVA